jgi:hypothetical protein
MTSWPAAVARLYRALLYLYPGAFRTEFGGEMACDFEDATLEAWTTRGWTGVLAVWTIVARDLIVTIPLQWLRNGMPAVIVLSAAWTTSFLILIGQERVWRHDMSFLTPPRTADQDMHILLLGSAVVFVLIVAIVIVTSWFWMWVVKRRTHA